MTVFPEWPEEAARLRANHASRAGLHLTLTDQPSLAGGASLAQSGALPRLANLLTGIGMRRIRDADVFAELDAQLARFEDAMGSPPAYIDGHQHVHFLAPVRSWLDRHAQHAKSPLPWLRGAPVASYSPHGSTAKIAALRGMAAGFGQRLARAGYLLSGPLAGFYDWRSGDDFAPTVDHGIRTLPDGGLLMVHPGSVDATLRQRDILTDTRAVELAYLASDAFSNVVTESGAEIPRQ